MTGPTANATAPFRNRPLALFPALPLTLALLAACGSSGGSATPDPGLAADTPLADAGEADVPAGDPGVPSDSTEPADAASPDAAPDAATTDIPWGAQARGWIPLRGIVHLHSLYSHDGCYGGKDEDRPADAFFQECLAQMRSAPCASGIDFMMQSDHPGNLRAQTFEDAVHYQPADGDTLVNDAQDRPVANRLKCPAGSPVARSYFFAGSEGHKNMPIGLSKPFTEQMIGTDYGDEADLATAQAAIAAVHEAGGYAFAAHTEESNISAERIMALPLDGMEIYNLHAALIGDIEQLLKLDPFMVAGDGPSPDLALLLLLAPLASDVTKFDTVSQKIRISFVTATDIHRNVELPILCPDGLQDGGFCENMAQQYPGFAGMFVTGGPVILSDGDRIDSYARPFRWFSNHVLAAADDPDAIRQAVGQGRGYAAFDILGLPEGFDFFGELPDGTIVEMGQEVKDVEAITLHVRAPTLVSPPWSTLPAGIDYAKAEVKTRLLRVRPDDPMSVELSGQGQTLTAKLDGGDQVGVFRVEVSVVPKHFAGALAGQSALADRSYPFVYSNAIFVR